MSNVPSNLIPTRITQLPMAPVASEDGLLLFIYQGNSYQIRAGDLLSVAGVPTTRQVSAGTGLTGGGPLATDITLSVAVGGIGSAQLAASGVTPGTYGSSATVPVFTVDATGRVMSITNVAVAVSGYVPESRQVIAGAGLTGGGALNANVTLVANLSNSTPTSGYQTGASGVATAMSRSDHRHPAVDLANDNEVDGLLGLSNGGTAKSIVPDAGAIIWCGADGLYVSVTGSAGQVLVSGGASAPSWGSAMIISDQPANVVYAGPASGPAGLTTFRALVTADLPSGTGTVTSVAALTLGTTGTDLSSTVANGSTTPVITLQVPTASATNRGALSSADWSTFNNKQPAGAYLAAVDADAPLTGYGTSASHLSIPAATSLVNGYLTSTDWTTFNGKQNTFGNQLANVVYAGPTGASGPPSFRALIAADVPTLNQNTSGTAGGLSGTPSISITDLTASGKVAWTGGRVTYVPATGDIQAYVTAASAGDTLILSAATYVITATITVNKAILIKGQGLSATKITTATADIAAFTLTASSARVTDLYIGHSGTGTTYGIYANDGLTGLQVSNVIVVTSGAGFKNCLYSKSSITVSNSEFYPTSSDSSSNGIYIANDSGATVNIFANVQNCRVLATGVTSSTNGNRGLVLNNNNTTKTITVNLFNSNLVAYASSGSTDAGIFVASTTTTNVTLNAYDSVIQGADVDVYNTTGNTITVYNCTLVNGTTTGTITKAGTQVGANQTLSGQLTSTVATGTAPFVVASTTQVANLSVATAGTAATLTTSRNIAGVAFNGSADIAIPLANLSDATIASPVVDQILKYNGTAWVNGNPNSVSGGSGVEFFNATPSIIATGTNNVLPLLTLSQSPVTTAEQTTTTTSINGTIASSAWLSPALARTTIDAGVWDYTVFASASGATTTLTRQMYAALPFVTGTLTTTGTGTTRTATASAGTPFSTSAIVASATNTLASYLQTPQGLYQISARTDDLNVTIIVPSGYANESAVAASVWKLLFGGLTTPSLTTTITQYDITTTQAAFTVTAATKLGGISFVTSTNAGRTVTTTYNGTTRNTHIATPLAVLHNQLGGLQGGTASEQYHLTDAEYVGTGTGVFVRAAAPTFTGTITGISGGTF